MAAGEEVKTEVQYPKGHDKNPLDDKEVEAKFHTLFRGYGDENQGQAMLQALWRFERVTDVRDALRLLVNESINDSGDQ